MAKKGKKYRAGATLVDRNKFYSPAEAAELLKKTATKKFDESIDCAVRLNVDPRHVD